MRKGAITAFNVQFSGTVAGAGNPANYHLLLVTTKKVKKKVVTTTKRLGIKSVIYNASTNIAELVAAGKLVPGKVNELTITAAGLIDFLGRPLDGDDDGEPGGDLIATIRGKVVTIR